MGLKIYQLISFFAGAESDWLFGITKRSSQMSVAANRGLPNDISIETRQSINSWREFEKEESNFSFEELFGFSHITYEEIMRLELANEEPNNDGWSKVFDKMHFFYMQGNLPTDIRVIVWAIW